LGMSDFSSPKCLHWLWRTPCLVLNGHWGFFP